MKNPSDQPFIWLEEAPLADSLARRLVDRGWAVTREEYLGPKCRADLVLRSGTKTLVVEVKCHIGGPKGLERAFDQLRGYVRRFDERTFGILVAGTFGHRAQLAVDLWKTRSHRRFYVFSVAQFEVEFGLPIDRSGTWSHLVPGPGPHGPTMTPSHLVPTPVRSTGSGDGVRVVVDRAGR